MLDGYNRSYGATGDKGEAIGKVYGNAPAAASILTAGLAIGCLFVTPVAILKGLAWLGLLWLLGTAVVVQAIRALGRSARDPAVLEQLRRFYLHPDWQFRLEAVQALGVLLDREVLSSRDLAGDLDQVLASSPFFEPEFPLKEALRELASRVRPTPSE